MRRRALSSFDDVFLACEKTEQRLREEGRAIPTTREPLTLLCTTCKKRERVGRKAICRVCEAAAAAVRNQRAKARRNGEKTGKLIADTGEAL